MYSSLVIILIGTFEKFLSESDIINLNIYLGATLYPPVDKLLLLKSFREVADFCKYVATYRSHDVSFLTGLGLNAQALEFLIDALDMLAYSVEQKIADENRQKEELAKLERARQPGKIIDIREYLGGVKL